MAKITAVSVSEKKGMRKTNVDEVFLAVEHGIEGDAHAGDWHRQVSLLAKESMEKMQKMGLDLKAGDFAENLTTEGIELTALPVGTRLNIGEDVLVEVTQIGKVCHDRCGIYYQAGDCVMPREGVLVRVLAEGRVASGDDIKVLDKQE